MNYDSPDPDDEHSHDDFAEKVLRGILGLIVLAGGFLVAMCIITILTIVTGFAR